jgi:excisionase family DNA binding protein
MNMVAEERGGATEQGLVSPREAASYLQLSRTTVYTLMRTGQLAYCQIGRRRRIPRRALEEFTRRSMVAAPAGTNP